MFEEQSSPERMWFMLLSPVPADPGPGDLAWLDRDPERECWLDRAREHDEPPEPVGPGCLPRRPLGQAARPAAPSPRQPSGSEMALDVLPGCAQLAVAADAGDDVRRIIIPPTGWCPTPPEPGPADPECGRGSRLAGPRPGATGTAGHLDTHLPGTTAALPTRCAWARPGSPPPACSMRPRPAPPTRCWTGPAAASGRRDARASPARPGRPRRSRPAVGRGFRQRRAGGPGAVPGPGAGGG